MGFDVAGLVRHLLTGLMPESSNAVALIQAQVGSSLELFCRFLYRRGSLSGWAMRLRGTRGWAARHEKARHFCFFRLPCRLYRAGAFPPMRNGRSRVGVVMVSRRQRQKPARATWRASGSARRPVASCRRAAG
jgi:hypothetical protein